MNRSRLEGIRAVVFDAVGTLIDPDPPVAVVYAQAALRQGVLLEISRVRSRFARAFSRAEATDRDQVLATDEDREVRRWRRIVSDVLPEIDDPERAFLELWDHFGRPDAWRVFADVKACLEILTTSRLRTGIASNFDGRLRPIVRSLPELRDREGALVISSEVGWKKPHPRFYLEICRALDLSPSEILYIGDDPENDLIGPAAVGMKAVLLDRAGRLPEHSPRIADLIRVPALMVEPSGRPDPAGSLDDYRPIVR